MGPIFRPEAEAGRPDVVIVGPKAKAGRPDVVVVPEADAGQLDVVVGHEAEAGRPDVVIPEIFGPDAAAGRRRGARHLQAEAEAGQPAPVAVADE